MFCLAFAQTDEDTLGHKWQRWLDETVVYIISDEEKTAFLQLRSDEQREAFEKAFWLQRDPTPGTEQNQFKEEHFERIEFANKYFGPGSVNPGWKTERGRIYITLGPPRTRDTYPSGTATYPMELWFYEGDVRRGLPSHFYLLFFQRFGAGEYELYNPVVDGPQALVALTTTSTDFDRILQDVDDELARAAYSLIPTGQTMRDQPSLGTLNLFSRIQQYHNTGVDTSYVEDLLSGKSTTHIDYSFSNLQLPHFFMPATDESGNSFVDVAFVISPLQVKLGQYKDEIYGVFLVEFSIATKAGVEIYATSDKFEFRFPSQFANVEKDSSRLYDYRLPCIPGDFQLTIRVRNEVSREIFLLHGEVSVPQLPAKKPDISRMMLCSVVESRDKNPGDGALQYAEFHAVPLLPGTINTGNTLFAYNQLYLPVERRAADGTFNVSAELLDKAGNTLEKQGSTLPHTAFSETGLFHLLTRWPSLNLLPGQYSIRVSAEFGEDGILIKELPFVVTENKVLKAAVLTNLKEGQNFDSRKMAQAEMWMNIGHAEIAQKVYRSILMQFPDHTGARTALAKAYMSEGKNAESLDLLLPALSESPRDADLLLLTARSYFGTGEYTKTLKMLSRLKAVSPGNPECLNLLGYAHLLNGEPVNALAAWKESLKVDRNQSDIRAAISRISSESAEKN